MILGAQLRNSESALQIMYRGLGRTAEVDHSSGRAPCTCPDNSEGLNKDKSTQLEKSLRCLGSPASPLRKPLLASSNGTRR